MIRKVVFGIGLCAFSLLSAGRVTAASGCDGSGNCYVRQAAAGNGSGADWTNACTDLAGNCAPIHGVTYFLAGGLYGFLILSDSSPGSGSILRATATAHGTNTGWNNSFDGQVTFSWNNSGQQRAISFLSSGWTVDGITGSGAALANYGFTIAAPGTPGGPNCAGFSGQDFNITVGNSGNQVSNITIKHVSMTNCAPTMQFNTDAFGLGCGQCYLTNIDLENNYSTGNELYFNITNMAMSTMKFNVGDSFFGVAGGGTHAEVIATSSVPSSGLCSPVLCNTGDVFAFNQIRNCRNSACMETIISGGDTISVDHWQIYGNIIVDDESGDGVFAANMQNTVIYQNTTVNSDPFFPNTNGGTGNIIENNLLINADATIGPGATSDYNTYWNPSTMPNIEAHGQVVNAATCPLVSCALDITGNYNLLVAAVSSCSSIIATCLGLPLPAPFNVDLNGTSRGTAGTWDRGALVFNSNVPPQPISNLSLIPH